MIGRWKLTLHKAIALILKYFVYGTPSNFLCSEPEKSVHSIDYWVISQMTDISPSSEENREVEMQRQD